MQHMRISRMPVSSEAMLGQAFVLLVLTSIKWCIRRPGVAMRMSGLYVRASN